MEDISKLKVFGLTTNQANLLKFFIESYRKENIMGNNLTFKEIKKNFKSNKSFYRELVSDLTKAGFLQVINKTKPSLKGQNHSSKTKTTTKPFVYRYNDSRMAEIIQEGQDSYLNEQKEFDKKIKEIKILLDQKSNVKQVKGILKDSESLLGLNDESISIIYTLFSQKNGKIVPISMTIKEITDKIGENNVRYNLKLLVNRDFIKLKKIGRRNSYEPNDLVTLFKIEKDFQKKKWLDKKRFMQEVIQYFHTKPSIDKEEVQKFSGVSKLQNYIEFANKEILIIHPFYKGKTDSINKRVQIIIEKILSYLDRSEVQIKVLIAGKIEDLDPEIIRQVLKKIPHIEVKTTSRLLNTFTIIIDSKYTIHAFQNSLDFMLIQDEQTVNLYETEFYKSWKIAEDFRIRLTRNKKLKEQLAQEIEESLNNYPIVHENKSDYEIIHLGKNIVEIFKDYLRLANHEIILDFRGDIERLQVVEDYFRNFFSDLIDVLNKKDLKVKLLLGINSWLVNKLDKIFIDLIKLMSQGKLEFRVQTENTILNRAIIIDDSLSFQIMTDRKTISSYNALIIRNPVSISEIKTQFNKKFGQSTDFRNTIMQYDIDKELEKTAKQSLIKNPPIYNIGTRPIVMQGKRDVIEIVLNLLRKAKKEILIVANPFFISRDGRHEAFETVHQRELYSSYFEVFTNKVKDNITVKILRNSSKPVISQIKDESQTKLQLKTLISLFPMFQFRQIDLAHSNFIIIDNKTLIIHEFLESNQLKIIIISENLLVKKYEKTFQDAWDKALDIRLIWLSAGDPTFKKEILSSFDQLEFQMTLPERGEMRIYDAKYLRHILKCLLDNTHQEFYMFLAASKDFIKQSKGKEAFAHMVLSFSRDVMEAIKNKKIQSRVIASFQPTFLSAITYNDIKRALDLYPVYQLRFSLPPYQSNIIYTIYDHYTILILGENSSSLFQLLLINDVNFRGNYLNQFINAWNNSIDVRQVYYEYGSNRKKELISKSYKRIKLEKKYTSEEIRQFFPIKKSIDAV